MEDDVLRQQIEQYNETVSRYQLYHQQQHHHHHHQQQQQQEVGELSVDPASQRRQSAPADVVQALLDISTLPSHSAVQLPTCMSHHGH